MAQEKLAATAAEVGIRGSRAQPERRAAGDRRCAGEVNAVLADGGHDH
jgi:hypothetical protein